MTCEGRSRQSRRRYRARGQGCCRPPHQERAAWRRIALRRGAPLEAARLWREASHIARVAGAITEVSASLDSAAFAALQARGLLAMGVDQYTSTHRFDMLPDGARIQLQRDTDDPAGDILLSGTVFGSGGAIFAAAAALVKAHGAAGLPDAREGLASHQEKRPPRFTGPGCMSKALGAARRIRDYAPKDAELHANPALAQDARIQSGEPFRFGQRRIGGRIPLFFQSMTARAVFLIDQCPLLHGCTPFCGFHIIKRLERIDRGGFIGIYIQHL